MSGRILHIGVGNFCRAHLADFTQDAGGWTVTGVSLRSATVRDGLIGQNWRYTLAVMGQPPKQITVFDNVLVAPENPSAVVETLADPSVAIISTTVTEKGYCFDQNGRLDLTHPAVQTELETGAPQSVIGYLTYGLAQRRAPATVLCCDNMQDNGSKLGQAIRDFAVSACLEMDFELLAFPNAMVDRITPATTDELRSRTGDQMAVPTEPFREWVIEDTFVGPRPNWPGVDFVADVAPHEMRKLRMLNGAHSFLAYAGINAGFTYVHEAIADPDLARDARDLMQEAIETLPPEVSGAEDYARALIARFQTPEIKHELRQIAMDGSQKLPYRILATMRDRHLKGLSSPALEKALVAWSTFCRAEMQAGRRLQDPMADEIAACVSRGVDPVTLISA